VLGDIRKQGGLDTLLTDIDALYAEFRQRFGKETPQQIN